MMSCPLRVTNTDVRSVMWNLKSKYWKKLTRLVWELSLAVNIWHTMFVSSVCPVTVLRKVIRPARELKGFARVHLEAGEEKAVTIPFDEYTFRYFNVQTNKFEVEGGAYDILIAASSEDIRLRGTLEVRTPSAAWSPSSSVV